MRWRCASRVASRSPSGSARSSRTPSSRSATAPRRCCTRPLDRYVDSSLAYQGAGRGLGVEAVGAINDFATAGLIADRTLLLAIDPSAGRSRRGARDEHQDRLEREADEFFARVAAAYALLAAENPARIRTLDATRSPDELLDAALAELSDLFE
jgi:dTMP kinase